MLSWRWKFAYNSNISVLPKVLPVIVRERLEGKDFAL
jgi:hypothetical protein